MLQNHRGEWCVARAKLYALGSLRKGLVHFLACLGACSQRVGPMGPSSWTGSSGLGPTNWKP